MSLTGRPLDLPLPAEGRGMHGEENGYWLTSLIRAEEISRRGEADTIFNPDADVLSLCCALDVDVYQLLIFGVWEGENVTVVSVVIVSGDHSAQIKRRYQMMMMMITMIMGSITSRATGPIISDQNCPLIMMTLN